MHLSRSLILFAVLIDWSDEFMSVPLLTQICKDKLQFAWMPMFRINITDQYVLCKCSCDSLHLCAALWTHPYSTHPAHIAASSQPTAAAATTQEVTD